MIRAIKLKKIVFFVIIFLIFLIIFHYKNNLFGNNIIKNRNKIEEKILNSFENYSAEMEITVNSNKTSNSYEIYQEVSDNQSKQEVKKGENIEGLKIELNQNNLKISNTKLNLEKVYENYTNLLNNSLFLNTFSNDYRNEENTTNYSEENDEIIMEVKLNKNQNTYISSKILHVNHDTLKPTKLEVKDNTNKETICIIYNSIELNK